MKNLKNKKVLIPVAFLVMLSIILILTLKKHNNYFSGVVEATTYDLSFKVPGKVAEIAVMEGDHVKKGALLAMLDQKPLEADFAQVKARVETAQANLNNLLAGARPQEIAQARAKLASAKANLLQMQNGATPQEMEQARANMEALRENYLMVERGYREEDVKNALFNLEAAKSSLATSKKDYERYRNLYGQGAISAQAFDLRKNQYEQALSGYGSAKENYQKAAVGFRSEEKKSAYQRYQAGKAQYEYLAVGTRKELIQKAQADVDYWQSQLELLLAGARKDEVDAARKRLQEAEAALKLARINLRDSRILAPESGVIISKNFEESEMVGAAVPVVSMADIKHPWVYIFVPEPDVGKINLGDRASVRVDSFPQKRFAGRVVRIFDKAEFTPKFIQTQRERVKLVFRVKIEVENEDLLLKPGMPADVEIFHDGK